MRRISRLPVAPSTGSGQALNLFQDLNNNLYFLINMENKILAEIFGFSGGLLIALSLLPQIHKSWKTKSVEDISLLLTTVYSFGLLMWLVYGLLYMTYAVLFMASTELLLALTMFFLKIKYSKK